MRTSVLIGFGLWLLAVCSVASVAWLAIDSAARPVTALSISDAPAPSATDPFTSVPSIPATSTPVPPVTSPVSSQRTTAGSTSTGATSPADGAASGATPAGAPIYYGSFSTEGGRVRARCIGLRADLDGGYARPETGWLVRVFTDNVRVMVVFASQPRAISVLVQCESGRPVFQQQITNAGSPTPPQPSASAALVSPAATTAAATTPASPVPASPAS